MSVSCHQAALNCVRGRGSAARWKSTVSTVSFISIVSSVSWRSSSAIPNTPAVYCETQSFQNIGGNYKRYINSVPDPQGCSSSSAEPRAPGASVSERSYREEPRTQRSLASFSIAEVMKYKRLKAV